MGYQSDTIATIINRLNVRYFLPAIQREFVWDPEQIIELFDSIMRGYPISSFLFWELKPENRDRWEVYKFVQTFRQYGTHNELATTDGVHQLTLVLDGQQRLTSLLIGLKGTFTIKKKYMRWDNPDAWVKHSLYLNLLQDPETESEDREFGVRYGFRFRDSMPTNSPGEYWVKVGRILDFDSEDRFDTFKYEEADKLPETTTVGQVRLFQRNLDRLYAAVWKRDVIAHYTEHDQDYDRVLDIFVRANEGGTKLSKSDLLLSMVTSKWSGFNAREEIYSFVDRINNHLIRKNYVDKDFVMKTCLVLTDLPVQYRVQNFSNQNLARIYQQWKPIRTAIEAGMNLVNSFGIDRDTLTSANALIPIIYYLFQRPGTTFLGSTPSEVQNALRIRTWLMMALLNRVFGGASDTILTDIRRVLQEHHDEQDFPLTAINAKIGESGRTSYFDAYAIDSFLAITYGRRETFLALSLLYDENRWGTMIFHQDHIFPRALFTPGRLAAAGLDSDTQTRYLRGLNRIGNLQLLLQHENQEKSAQDFETWIATRDPGFKQRHMIPTDPTLYRFERFEKFIAAREQLIKERLAQLFVGMAA